MIRGVSSRGGTRSSKTWSMLQLLFLLPRSQKLLFLLISCVTDTMPGSETWYVSILKRMLQDEGLWNGNSNEFNRNDLHFS